MNHITLNLFRLFVLFILSVGFHDSTYAYNSRRQTISVSDTVPEKEALQLIKSGRKGAGAAMALGFSSIFSQQLGFVLVAISLTSPVYFIIGGILGISAMILGISTLKKLKKAKALNPAGNEKYRKLTKRVAITDILLGALGFVLGVVLTSAYYYFY